jgi:hypothetical protein
VDRTDSATLDDATDFPKSWVKVTLVAHLKDNAPVGCHLDQIDCLINLGHHRFLYEDVNASFDTIHCLFVVECMWRDDRYSVQLSAMVVKEFPVVFVRWTGELLLENLSGLLSDVHSGDDGNVFGFVERLSLQKS